jgi:DNA helicase HerA-like ATPase
VVSPTSVTLASMGDMVGRVIGTEDATPLEFWVAVAPGEYLQLDDVVALERVLPTGEPVRVYGMVSQVRARHEGARFDSDVFLISDGVLPAEVSEAAKVTATRFEPEIFVPPRPGQPVARAEGDARDRALFFDRMERRLAVGLTRENQPLYINFEFLNGERGAHVNISGVSGVATKTTYATFLLHSLFTGGVLGPGAVNTKALIFNVKGEDLLHLDRPNAVIDDEQVARYRALGLPADPFKSVGFYAPPRVDSETLRADVHSRQDVTSFCWSLAEFCHDELLPFLFADAEDDRAQYSMVVYSVMAQLKRAAPRDDGSVTIEGTTVRTFRQLVDLITDKVLSEDDAPVWAGTAIGRGTINAFVRRLNSAVRHVDRLIRGNLIEPEKHRISTDDHQVTVVDLHNLNDRAKRFVVGVTVRRAFELKERQGRRGDDDLLFVVLDELNKYAPRDGTSPIKEILLDVAERGRSLGIVLIGAQQTASEVERRIIANSSIRVVGRLDSAEAAREEYGFLPGVHRQRATIIKPGTMLVSQPELPVPLVAEFPFPAWATRPSEAVRATGDAPDDPFEGLVP